MTNRTINLLGAACIAVIVTGCLTWGWPAWQHTTQERIAEAAAFHEAADAFLDVTSQPSDPVVMASLSARRALAASAFPSTASLAQPAPWVCPDAERLVQAIARNPRGLVAWMQEPGTDPALGAAVYAHLCPPLTRAETDTRLREAVRLLRSTGATVSEGGEAVTDAVLDARAEARVEASR